MIRVLYINEVTCPAHLVGKVDEVRELPDGDAVRLIAEGFCVGHSATPLAEPPPEPKQ